MSSPDLDAQLEQLLAPGNVFEEKYEVLSELGTGSFALVVKARHAVMGREVALKCLKPSVVRSNPEVSERFVNEVQIVSRLRHPNTVTIFDFGQTADDLAYMVLEYLSGETLDKVLAREGAFSQERALRICRQILKSLAEAHAQGIIHRDLKPSNIMLTELHGEPDFVKVLDFGVAKLLEDAEDDERFQPRSTRFIGTPVYMSPEQVLGKSVGPSSDMYGLGLLLYQMLTGRTPIAHDTVPAVVQEHLSDKPLDLEGLDALHPRLRRLIRRATERYPVDRFSDVAEFARALPGRESVDSIERARPEPAAQVAEGLVEESSEADVFSGKNYIAPPEPEEEEIAGFDDNPIAPPRPASRTSNDQTKSRRPEPSPSSRDIDLDLDTVERQRRRIERKRRAKAGAASASARKVDGDWEAREYWRRLSVYGLGLASAYWSFVLLSAMLYEQSGGARFLAGALLIVSSVAWTAFSSTRAVGVDFARRWLLPSARNFIYILCVLLLAASLWKPAEAAAGLSKKPTWFFEGLPQIPPLTWMEAATLWGSAKLAALFDLLAGVLPYV